MFKNLLAFWQGKNFLTQVLENFKDMLLDAEEMFDSVCRRLIHNENIPDLKDKIYDIDKKINTLEKEIRMRIVEHLSVQPAVDVSMSLLLMSVVKDAERLGDYCKNLFEVTQLLEKPIELDNYRELFDNIEQGIMDLFKHAKQTFSEPEEDKALHIWERKQTIAQKCDTILQKLASSSLSSNKAVCYTLMARHYKRLAAHLTNIATSVVVPISDLDYFDEKRKDELNA